MNFFLCQIMTDACIGFAERGRKRNALLLHIRWVVLYVGQSTGLINAIDVELDPFGTISSSRLTADWRNSLDISICEFFGNSFCPLEYRSSPSQYEMGRIPCTWPGRSRLG
jgi:hypothetical protein